MGVAEVQAALARLYVEPELCERLRKDPDDLCHEMGLDGSDAEQVRSLAVDQVEAFARSLRNKRLGEVRTLLPRTSRALGDRYRPLFQDFASGFVPAGIHRHSQDAVTFADYMLHRLRSVPPEPPWIVDLIRFERAVAKMALPAVGFEAVILRYDVSDLDQKSEPPRRTCIHGWLRLQRGGKMLYLVLRGRRAVTGQAADVCRR